jgi:hypothetical protein
MVVLVGTVLLVGGTGLAQWRGNGFPAGSERLAGTPVELRAQSGVGAHELRPIRGGIRLVDRYVDEVLGRPVRGPVEGRIARHDRCTDSESGERSLIGQAGPGFLCVDTANIEWKVLLSENRLAAIAVSGHEYAHVWQAELGCLPSGDRREYRWLVEGMATYLAWRALVHYGVASERLERRTIRRGGDWDSNREPLRTYEREGGRQPQYALWHLAIHKLLHEAVARRVTPANMPDLALRRFCERVGAGLPWRAAFLRSFGLSVEAFYARFEASRPRP